MKLIISAVSFIVRVVKGTFFFFKPEDSLDSLGLRILETGNSQESYSERGSAWSQNCRNPEWPGRGRNMCNLDKRMSNLRESAVRALW